MANKIVYLNFETAEYLLSVYALNMLHIVRMWTVNKEIDGNLRHHVYIKFSSNPASINR